MAKDGIRVHIYGDYDDKQINNAIKGLESLRKQSKSTSDKMQDMGKKMSLAVTAPLAAVGAAAAKASMDFDDSMTKIVGLVGIGAEEVDAMKQSVLGLAGETAQAPTQLADAMFVVQSAGLRGAEAMEALEAAAKAGSAGLGATSDVARSVAGALNAYGSEVLSAAEATDIIVATARAGNFETSQFAGALGDVLPFAQAAQASFQDVGGAVALLTRTNGNAAKSITQVTALFRAFAAPSKQTQTLLAEVGLSAEDLRESMAEQGLSGTLRMLDDALGGNREQLGLLLGSSEATGAALQILNADADALDGTFGTVADSAGITDEAFGAASETAGFKFRQAIQSLQATMITFGDTLAPVISKVAGFISGLANGLGALPGPVKTLVVGFGAIVAAIGPLLFIGGKVLAMFASYAPAMLAFKARMLGAFRTVSAGASTMSMNMKVAMIGAQTQMGAVAAGSKVMAATMVTAFRTIGGAIKGMIASLGPIGIAIVAISTALGFFMGRSKETRAELQELQASLDQTTGKATELSQALVEKDLRLNLSERDKELLREMGIGLDDLIKGVTGSTSDFRDLQRRLEKVASETKRNQDANSKYAGAITRARRLVDEYGNAISDASNEHNIARDAAFAAARGTDASGSSAMESVYAYDAATGGLKVMAGGMNDAAVAAQQLAIDSAAAAEAARAAAYNATNDRKAYFDLAAAYNKAARDARNAGTAVDRSFGSGGTANNAMDEYERIVEQAMSYTQGLIDDTVQGYKDKFLEAAEEAGDFADGLSQGLQGGLNFGAAVDAAKEGGTSITTAIADQAGKVISFGDKLQALLKTNLSREAFEAVASMSAERGSALADELLGANSATIIDNFNKVLAAVTFVSDNVGALAAEKWYGEGVRFAQRTYEGVRDNFKKGGPGHTALMNLMNKLARESARQAEIEVRVTKKINEQVTRVVTTIAAPNPATPGPGPEFAGASGAIVTRPTFSLIGEAGPEALIPLDRAPGASPVGGLSGGNITINVNAGMGTDGAEVGRQVVDAIKAYERRNGRVYATA